MTGIADNSRFALNGRGKGELAQGAASKGKADIRKAMKDLIDLGGSTNEGTLPAG